MQAEFLKYDQEAMISAYGLDHDDRWVSFMMLGCGCRIDRATGVVECENLITGSYEEAGFNAAMTAYDLLCYGKPEAKASGQFVQLRQLSGIHGSGGPDPRSMSSGRARELDHRDEELRAALERLGGGREEREKGDVSARIRVFRDLDMIFRYYNSDDEFPAEMQYLWDANALSYMHYETLWYADGLLTARIMQLMKEV